MQVAADHLDAVAGEPDHAFDQIDRIVARMLEHRNVAALGARAEDAAGEQVGRERKRVAAVAVAELRDEQRVADKQRRLHRPGGNVEGLQQEAADNDDEDDDRQPEPYRPADYSRLPFGAHRSPSRRPAAGRVAYPTNENSRLHRTDHGQRQSCQADSPSPIEKKMICAFPTRFSSGTYPTADSTRLSVELSRLSPIMK